MHCCTICRFVSAFIDSGTRTSARPVPPPPPTSPSPLPHLRLPSSWRICVNAVPSYFPPGLCVKSPFFFFFPARFYFPASGQAVVTGVIPSPPRFLPSIFIAHRVQQSRCSSIVHRMLLTHALALSASQLSTRKSPNEFIQACTRRGSNSRN